MNQSHFLFYILQLRPGRADVCSLNLDFYLFLLGFFYFWKRYFQNTFVKGRLNLVGLNVDREPEGTLERPRVSLNIMMVFVFIFLFFLFSPLIVRMSPEILTLTSFTSKPGSSALMRSLSSVSEISTEGSHSSVNVPIDGVSQPQG